VIGRNDVAMSTVTVIGCGNMARGIASRALVGGSDVQLLDRRPEKARALAKELSAQVSGGQVGAGQVSAGALGDPPAGNIVVLAVPYSAAAPVVQSYGAQLDGKVIVDITNPVDFASSTGWSPRRTARRPRRSPRRLRTALPWSRRSTPRSPAPWSPAKSAASRSMC
jgi:predicted dinucleotide-binding enzyme